jgi:hypothetical protein
VIVSEVELEIDAPLNVIVGDIVSIIVKRTDDDVPFLLPVNGSVSVMILVAMVCDIYIALREVVEEKILAAMVVMEEPSNTTYSKLAQLANALVLISVTDAGMEILGKVFSQNAPSPIVATCDVA